MLRRVSGRLCPGCLYFVNQGVRKTSYKEKLNWEKTCCSVCGCKWVSGYDVRLCVYAPASRKRNKRAGQRMRRGPNAKAGGPQWVQVWGKTEKWCFVVVVSEWVFFFLPFQETEVKDSCYYILNKFDIFGWFYICSKTEQKAQSSYMPSAPTHPQPSPLSTPCAGVVHLLQSTNPHSPTVIARVSSFHNASWCSILYGSGKVYRVIIHHYSIIQNSFPWPKKYSVLCLSITPHVS